MRDCSMCKAGMGLRSLHPPESRLRERLSGQGWGASQRLAGPALPEATPTQPSSPSPLPGSAGHTVAPAALQRASPPASQFSGLGKAADAGCSPPTRSTPLGERSLSWDLHADM